MLSFVHVSKTKQPQQRNLKVVSQYTVCRCCIMNFWSTYVDGHNMKYRYTFSTTLLLLLLAKVKCIAGYIALPSPHKSRLRYI